MQSFVSPCYCGNEQDFGSCCELLLSGKQVAKSAEALMRSRFCAYRLQNYEYVLATYAQAQQKHLNIHDIAQGAADTAWLRLVVVKTQQKQTTAKVEFRAYYQVETQYYLMHETSDFIQQDQKWYYTSGIMHQDSGPYMQQRNDVCLCGSGKKFKKCCSGL
ncbi:MAG: YchJ family protein [Paraglaciecola sp.]|nr:YchJ family protein [Paraglaciecola sp.]